MDIKCPFCHAEIDCPDEYAGRKGQCPSCKQKFIVPELPIAEVIVSEENKQNKNNDTEVNVLVGYSSWLYEIGKFINGSIICLISLLLLLAGDFEIRMIGLYILVIALVLFLGAVANHYSFKYIITSKRIIVYNGLIIKNEQMVYHQDIRFITITRGLFDFFTKCGTINIATAATSNIEMKLKGIKSPKKTQDLLISLREENINQ